MAVRAPFCITFDNMGSARDVYLGHATRQADADPSMSIGYPRILALLAQLGIKGTFFIEGWNVLHNTQVVRSVAAAGHDIGLHGWIHEVFEDLTPHDRERLLWDALAAFRLIGVEPVGVRVSGSPRPPGLENPMLAMGLGFDSSVDWDNVRREPHLLNNGLPRVPVRSEMSDYYFYHMHPGGVQTPDQLQDALFDDIETCARTGAMCHFIFHAFVSGVDDARFAVLEAVLRKAARDPRLEIMTVAELARRALPGRIAT